MNLPVENMDWNDPFRRREVAFRLLMSDPNLSEDEKLRIATSLQLVKAMEDFRPISPPDNKPLTIDDILAEDDEKKKGGEPCNDNF